MFCSLFPFSIFYIIFPFDAVSELCVESTQKETACMVQIHHNLRLERYLFSFRSLNQVKHLLYLIQFSVCVNALLILIS